MAKIIELTGNIFNSQCEALVNTVNCMGVMGKGLALQFKFRYYEMYLEYQRLCENREIKPGKLHFWIKSKPYIINFPTKIHWKYPSKIEYIEKGLKNFADVYSKYNIKSVAFPELGTNLGKLSWRQVKDVMYDILEPLDNLFIEIYHYDNNAKDNLFLKLKDKIKNFQYDDYINKIKITKKQAQVLKKVIENDSTNKMIELHAAKGLGKKALIKIYKFAMSSNIQTEQLKLKF